MTVNDYNVTKQYYFGGWTAKGKEVTKDTPIDGTYLTDGKLILTPNWIAKISVSVIRDSGASADAEYLTITTKYKLPDGVETAWLDASSGGGNIYVQSGTTVTITLKATAADNNHGGYKNEWAKSNGQTVNNGGSITISEDTTITYGGTHVEKTSCIVEGTLIMLADGTQKKVEDLKLTDLVLTFNHTTGQFEARSLNLIAHKDDVATVRRVINLQFSDGSVLGIVLEHGLFDLTVNKYVFITEENMSEFIGHSFSKIDDDNCGYHAVTLVNAYVTEKVVRIFSPTSQGNINLITEGILTLSRIPLGAEELLNLFDFGEGMKYDEAKMMEDIEKFGTYSYEDFAEYMTYEEFINSPVAYLKVGVGKGLVTYEQIIQLLEYQKRYTE